MCNNCIERERNRKRQRDKERERDRERKKKGIKKLQTLGGSFKNFYCISSMAVEKKENNALLSSKEQIFAKFMSNRLRLSFLTAVGIREFDWEKKIRI